MKSLLSFLEMLMTIFWFGMDVLWMLDYIYLSGVLGVLAILINLIILFRRLYLTVINWNKFNWNMYVGNTATETSIICWLIMNLYWMLDMKYYAIIALIIGGIALIFSVIINGLNSIKYFRRFRRKE